METDKRSGSTLHLLILAGLAIAAGRIAVVSRDGISAFLSANDRSRWCTVASLVERGTFAIDLQEKVTYTDRRGKKTTPWQTIDKVRHTGKDGELHYYSSKPPLFPTMVAGVYAMVRMVTGMNLTAEPMYLTRVILALVNLPLLALFYYATADSVRRVCRHSWATGAAVIAICFGTMVLPFAISLNNHLPAAAATAAAMWIYFYAAERLSKESAEPVPTKLWFAAGVAAAFAAANELPALSMLVFWGILFLVLDRASVLPFVAGVLVVAIGFFGTNWVAHDSLRPPYAHRGNGDEIATLNSSEDTLDTITQQEVIGVLINQSLASPQSGIRFDPSDEEDRWQVNVDGRLFALLRSPEQSKPWKLAHWDDWYEYPDTHWKPENMTGVDRGETSRLVYLAHMTVGHHGVFSLTPIWLLVPVGLVLGLVSGTGASRRFVFATLVATSVCVAFYLVRPTIDRNYGGVSACFRWLLWFAPLWLMVLAPVLDRIGERRAGRSAVAVMLAISIFSVSTAMSNPWQHPWIYQFWAFLGWIDAA